MRDTTRFSARVSWTVIAVAIVLALPAWPAHAILGSIAAAVGKAGAGAAGKGAAAAAGKGAAAAGAGAVVGAEVTNAAVTGAKTGAAAAGKGAAGAEAGAGTGAAVAESAATGRSAATFAGAPQSADEIARASGLGRVVPEDVAALLAPGKTLRDVPDVGARAWLSLPLRELRSIDSQHMVTDYVRLLEGNPTAGPSMNKLRVAGAAPTAPELPRGTPVENVPWYGVELLVRAAHLGHVGAREELDRVCRGAADPALRAQCRAGAFQVPARTSASLAK